MKPILITFFIFITLNDASAQTPGYLGKKIMIGYNFNLNPCSKRQLFVEFDEAPRIFFATKHEINLGFTASKNITLVASYLFQNNKTYHQLDYFYYSDRFVGKAYNNIITTVKEIGVRIHVKKFIAPVGTYIELTGGKCRSSFIDKDPLIRYYDYSNNGNYTEHEINGIGSYIEYDRFSISLGNTKTIKDKFYFNLAVKINANFNFYHFENDIPTDSYFKPTDFLRTSVRPMNWMEAKIGFGFLF